ncbi:MAG: chemotaxis protein CheW [Candidatus Sericytochromatia bacterium]|nr:chemotaxis protein CheW [Candidatus Sericytochromatia bacterium]
MSDYYVVTFLLADEAYCIPVSRVQEIQGYHAHPPPRPMPDAHPFFEGLIDLRGQVVPVLDLRQRFGLAKVTPSRKTCYIIIDTETEKVGLMVDAVMEVQHVGAQDFNMSPSQGSWAIHQNYILGVGKLRSKSAEAADAQRLVVLLDVDRLMAFSAAES